MSLKYADVTWLRVPRVTSKTNTAALPESAGRRAHVSHRESGDHRSDRASQLAVPHPDRALIHVDDASLRDLDDADLHRPDR